MALRRLLLLLTLLPLMTHAAPANSKKTKVSVYYESLSPKSKAFFTEQLYPVWLDLKEYIAVDLYVYGRTTERVDATGYKFECIHGPEECVGNVMMMCAKINIPTVEQYMGFSNCIMDEFKGAAKSMDCATQFAIDHTPIEQCASTFVGQHLLHQTGLKQQTLSPALESAPWILINDVFTEEQMMAAREDLRKVVCAVNKEVPATKCN
ncbi:gamma-interferon-inducible lysosomal thiol reductase-like [Portunus trituberculatus]|uniref:gamma-interferon-inducible lysosomal thiol reductase-like n=1 Tax=Portunus trituberculatus TaxID=210409 RepID=UPI001E1CD9AF|nr:gamma-interferon-inducible lysosomal thiol reductase-like [Portunus trituberculatus]